MRRTKNTVNIDEVRQAAQCCLPDFLYDFIEGGVDGEEGLRRIEAAFARYGLLPRYLVDISRRSTATDLLAAGMPCRSAFRRPGLRRCSDPLPTFC